MSSPEVLCLHPDDNVCVATRNLSAGASIGANGKSVSTAEAVRMGHKIATAEIPAGKPVIKYGQIIGFATQNIAPGQWVHSHNVDATAFERDYAKSTHVPPAPKPLTGYTFQGYRRADGRAGTRNYVAVISSVNCSATVSKYVARRFDAAALREFPNVDGVVAFTYGGGCGIPWEGEYAQILRRVLGGIARHPNIGGYVLIGLGCETMAIGHLIEDQKLVQIGPQAQGLQPVGLHGRPPHPGPLPGGEGVRRPPVLVMQDLGGTANTVEAGVKLVAELLPRVNSLSREAVPASEIILGTNCGGSDGNSGVTANPALGVASDMIVACGGTTILGETTEIYGAEQLLTRRAKTPEVADKLIERIKWWEWYSGVFGATCDNNPSPGNKEGGLTTIYEKSLGAIAKAGSTAMTEVYRYGDQVTAKGFVVMDTPGLDPVSVTGIVAGGANVMVFTTGRGSCFGCKPTPSIKVATNTPMYERMQADMDINAGTILAGRSIEDVGREIFQEILAVASGKQTKSEALGIGDEEFVPWPLGPTLLQTNMTSGHWEFWIDVGGTFTDCFALAPDGSLRRHKLLSSGATKGAVRAGSSAERIVDAARRADPPHFWRGAQFRLFDAAGNVVAESTVADFDAAQGALQLKPALIVPPTAGQPYELLTGEEAPVQGVRYLLGLPGGAELPPVIVRLGTTRGTNALITRRGARTALVTTRGFGDILHIGYQNRPKLFELNIRKPQPPFSATVEIDERVASSGEVLRPIDPRAVRDQLAALRSQQIESLAICLLHGSEHPAHERLVAEQAREVGFEEISISHQVAPLPKIVARGDTTVLDAYLNPVLRRYVASLRAAMPRCDLQMVTSAGGLVSAEQFCGKDSLLSGPAGGVVGFSRVAQAAGFVRAIGFDMGGTSTDVARFDGRYELEYETEKAGVRIVSPMLAIETVAAGGGSICAFDGVKLIVGPDSAGANPGPACYGRGGPLAVTDLNFYLGKIRPEWFPFPLDRAAVARRLTALADEVALASGVRYTLIELAEGLLKVANANMTRAIRSVSVAKGCDPREYVLVPFGGAAGQHACAIAEELGMSQILHHPDAGLLSAYGIGLADHSRHRAAGVHRAYSPEVLTDLKQVFERLKAEARAELQRDFSESTLDASRIEVRQRLDLRYRGLDAFLTIDEPTDGDYAAAYEAEHRKLYGYAQPQRPLEIVAARVEVLRRSSQTATRSSSVLPPAGETAPIEEEIVTAHFAGQDVATRVYQRAGLRPGQKISGPAIIHEIASTTVIDPGWRGEVRSDGSILATRGELTIEAMVPARPLSGDANNSAFRLPPSAFNSPDPALLEIFNNRFAGIAEQMGIRLRNTASSVNVKERLDFSCAVFTPRGELVVNAPHIPVHLGAMGETVRSILGEFPEMSPGDVFITNDPYRGGSHLPDVTVVTPVFGRDPGAPGERLRFFTASRAHHAEIGGITPGSMPPFSKNLAEEGVLIRPCKLIDAGRERFDELRELLRAGDHPTRAVDDNLADIAAQVAANHQGALDLLALIERSTLPVVQAYMQHIRTAAEHKLRKALAKLAPGRREFVDHLDDGTAIKVALISHSPFPTPHSPLPAITIDFTGSGPVHAGNLNANRAIVTAAVMYVLRLLIDEDIPLNEGVLAPVELILPDGILNPPRHDLPQRCAAVVGGNVETSQRIVDVLLGALGLAAASQGTMNNLLFGDAAFGYYETICGGSGATATANGADAVHTHMTNTRLTDPEIIERRYPVRVQEFRIRHGSGGAGQYHGGNGVVRRFEFLRPLEVSILSQRRGPHAPYGLSGGSPGALGCNVLTRADGRMESLPALAHVFVQAGDILSIETPGGGGWGSIRSDV